MEGVVTTIYILALQHGRAVAYIEHFLAWGQYE